MLLTVAAGSVLPAVPASAAPGRCAPGTGVTVVVDFGPLGGGTQLACDPGGAGRSAEAVVEAAGFAITRLNNGQPFVCRVAGRPDQSQEACVRTPPAHAYWGLFWADGTSSAWIYSSSSIAGLTVPQGGSVGLRWQDGGTRDDPGAAPTVGKVVSSPQPTPKPQPTPEPQPETQPQPRPSVTPNPSSQPPASPREAPRSAAPGAGPATTGPDGDRGRTGDKQKQKQERKGKVDETEAAGAGDATASPTPVTAEALTTTSSGGTASGGSDGGLALVAGGAMVALAAAAGLIGWRRRS
jgi:hypothetical protein